MKVPKKIVEKYFSFSNILYVLFLSDFCRVSKNRRHCLRVNHREKRADCQTGALQCERLYAAKCGIILFQFPVLLIRNGLTPFVGVLFARNFDGEMGEPGIRSGTVPVFDFRRNIDAVARLHLDGFFAFLLIVAASGHAYKDLSAAALCVVDMPVVAAAGFCFIIRILPNQRSPVWKLCLKAFLPRSLHQVRTVLILLLCCRIRCRRMSRRGRSSCL